MFLPAFAVAAVASGGEVDMGGYFIPSSTAATTLQATVAYKDPKKKLTFLTRSYLVDHALGAVSERNLREGIVSKGEYGVKVGKDEGLAALDELVEKIIRDPYWAYLQDYRKLVYAEANCKVNNTFDQKIAAVESATALLRPIAYPAEEFSVIRDSNLEAGMRAAIINDLREQRLGGELPPDRKVTPQQVQELFNDPQVDRSQVEAAIASRIIIMAMRALTPVKPPEPPAEAGAETGKPEEAGEGSATDEIKKIIKAEALRPGQAPPDPPDAAARRASLTKKLAARFKGQPQLTALLLAQAELSVGERWQPMAALLAEVDSPQTRRYLVQRAN